VNGFNTVAAATTISDSVVAECSPGVYTCKHTVGARPDIVLRCTQNATSTYSIRFGQRNVLGGNVLPEAGDVVRSIRLAACWLPKGSWPTAVGSWEAWVDRVESIMIKGVVDADFLTVKRGNGDLRQRDDLGRGNRVGRPIPVWLTKIFGSLFPRSLVDSISRGDSLCMLLKDLLKKEEIVSKALITKSALVLLRKA